VRNVVVHLSPLRRTKGGISTVVTNYLVSDLARSYRLIPVDSHTDRGTAAKIVAVLQAFLRASWLTAFSRVDLVHIHVGDFPSLYRKAIAHLPFRLLRARGVLHFHGAEFMKQYAAKNSVEKSFIRWLLHSFDVVICLSESWKRDLVAEFGIDNAVVIRNSIPIPAILAAPRCADQPLRLLFLGKIGERKGLFDLLDVVEELVIAGREVTLEVGGNGDAQALMRRIESGPLRDRVRHLGWITDVDKEKALVKAHVFVLPSYAEGMPMSILEAMSYGLPVVSTVVGGIPELVTDGANGILVSPGDTVALRHALTTLYDDDGLRRQMGLASRAAIEDRFSYPGHLRQVERVYEQCLDK